jgi:hypothetical protein
LAWSRPGPNPAVTTIGLVLCVAAAAGLLRWLVQLGPGTDQALADSDPFRAWVGVAALATVAFGVTFVNGYREVGTGSLRSSSPSLRSYGLSFMVFAAVAVVLLLVGGGGGPEVKIDYWTPIRSVLLLLGCAAAGPWIVLVWASHGSLRQSRSEIPQLPAAATAHAGGSDPLDGMLRMLLEVRVVIAKAIGHLLVIVLGATLLSGALHAALVPDFVAEDDFPATAVVAYGAFFTIMLSFAVLPLMIAWRRTANMLVAQAYPLRIRATAEDEAARARLSSALDINGSLFRSPVALGSILAPLITSLLAVFIPQLNQ